MVNENTRLDSGMGFDGQGDGSRDQLAGYVVHRMGMPRYDLSGVQRKGGFSELVSRNAVDLTISISCPNYPCKNRFRCCGTFNLPLTFEDVPVQ